MQLCYCCMCGLCAVRSVCRFSYQPSYASLPFSFTCISSLPILISPLFSPLFLPPNSRFPPHLSQVPAVSDVRDGKSGIKGDDEGVGKAGKGSKGKKGKGKGGAGSPERGAGGSWGGGRGGGEAAGTLEVAIQTFAQLAGAGG